MTQAEIVQILAGFVGTLGFGILFHIRKMRLLAAAAGGMLAWFLFLLLNKWSASEAVNYFIVSLLISFYNEIMARLLKTPTTVFATTCLVPLIPGGSLYYMMNYAFAGKSVQFLERGLYTLQLASALVLGIILASALTKIVCNLLPKKKAAGPGV